MNFGHMRLFLLVVFLINSLFIVNSARVDTNAIVKWDLAAASCSAGVIADTGTLTAIGNLVLNKTDGASCIQNGLFLNPRTGVLTTGTGLPNTRNNIMMTSGDITNLKSSLTASLAAPLKMSLEFWFQPTSSFADGDSATLLEISQAASTTNTNGVNNAGTIFALRLTYSKDSGDDTLELRISNSGNVRVFLISSPNFETVTDGIYHLVFVLDGTNNNLVYFNRKGTSFIPGVQADTSPVTSTSHWPSTHRVRLGVSASTAVAVAPIIYHSFVLHSQDLTQQNVNDTFRAGPPDSAPAAANSSSVVFEDTPSIPQGLSSAASYFDFDGNNAATVGIIFKTLPAKGTLSHDNINVIANTLYTDLTKIRYVQLPAFKDQATIDQNTNSCTAGAAAFDIFSYSLASPGCNPNTAACQSTTVNGTVCVQETNDPPEISLPDPKIVNVKAGGVKNFDVTGFDVDSQAGKGLGFSTSKTLTNGNIRIVTVPSSALGGYYRSNCATALVLNEIIPFNTSQDLIRLCYKANSSSSNQPEIGTHDLTYRLLDSANAESVATGTINTKIGNAVSGCEGGPVPSGLRAHCVSNGTEDSLIRVKLSGLDESSRPLTFKITSAPVNGTLCFGNVAGTACDTTIPFVLGTSFANNSVILYRPKPNFYNERNETFAPNTYVDRLGKGFSGCADLINGCPDTFNFVVIANGSVESPVATYKIFVRDVQDFLVPANLQYPTTFVFENQPVDLIGENTVRINDPDGDLYKIGVLIQTNRGQIRLTPPTAEGSLALDSNFVLLQCATSPDNGCDEISFITYPSLANRALATLGYLPVISSTGAVQANILIKLYKDSQVENQNSLGTAAVTVNIKPTEPEQAEQKDPLPIAIIAGASAAGLVVLVGTIWAIAIVVRKTQQAARTARKSIQRMRTLSQQRKHASNGGGSNALTVRSDADHHQGATAPAGSSSSSSRQVNHGGSSRKKETDEETADGADMVVADDSIFDWEKHIDKKTGDVYFFNPKTGVSQWEAPTVKAKRTKK